MRTYPAASNAPILTPLHPPQGVLARHALSGEAAPAPLPGGAAAPAPAIGAAAAAAATATAAAAAASGVSGPALTPLALRLLAMLGPFVHRDVRLFTKVRGGAGEWKWEWDLCEIL